MASSSVVRMGEVISASLISSSMSVLFRELTI